MARWRDPAAAAAWRNQAPAAPDAAQVLRTTESRYRAIAASNGARKNASRTAVWEGA